MQHEQFDLDEALAVLERIPASLSALLNGLPDCWIHATEGADSWSPYQVIDHLIYGERTNWIPRAQHIMAGHQHPFEPFDRTAATTENASSMAELLATFAKLRHANLAILVSMNLSQADLQRTGLHPELGEVRLAQLLATWVAHDLNHVGQIVQTIARQYTTTVGPWRSYLFILEARS